MTHPNSYDVIILGGSYSGLSAAMALGRSLRNVLVIDSGQPCNATTPQSHNFLTQDGQTPAAIATKAREQVQHYTTIQFLEDQAIQAHTLESGFEILTQTGQRARAHKLIIATGIRDQLPAIPGFAECWGISAIHCPYCHGYEYRQQRTGILANGEAAMHYAQLIGNLSKDLRIFTQGKPNFSEEQSSKLAQHAIPVIETEVARIEHEQGHIRQILLKDETVYPLDALYYRPPFTQHSDIPAALGCEMTEQGYIRTDAFQKTSVTGVFACGDNSSMMRSLATAIATGNAAGAMVNRELTEERF